MTRLKSRELVVYRPVTDHGFLWPLEEPSVMEAANTEEAIPSPGIGVVVGWGLVGG